MVWSAPGLGDAGVAGDCSCDGGVGSALPVLHKMLHLCMEGIQQFYVSRRDARLLTCLCWLWLRCPALPCPRWLLDAALLLHAAPCSLAALVPAALKPAAACSEAPRAVSELLHARPALACTEAARHVTCASKQGHLNATAGSGTDYMHSSDQNSCANEHQDTGASPAPEGLSLLLLEVSCGAQCLLLSDVYLVQRLGSHLNLTLPIMPRL